MIIIIMIIIMVIVMVKNKIEQLHLTTAALSPGREVVGEQNKHLSAGP